MPRRSSYPSSRSSGRVSANLSVVNRLSRGTRIGFETSCRLTRQLFINGFSSSDPFRLAGRGIKQKVLFAIENHWGLVAAGSTAGSKTRHSDVDGCHRRVGIAGCLKVGVVSVLLSCVLQPIFLGQKIIGTNSQTASKRYA